VNSSYVAANLNQLNAVGFLAGVIKIGKKAIAWYDLSTNGIVVIPHEKWASLCAILQQGSFSGSVELTLSDGQTIVVNGVIPVGSSAGNMLNAINSVIS
jgi:hypothetical protein